MTRRPSLRDEIVRLYQEHKTVGQIASMLGCSKANVSMTIRRNFSWNQTISPPLPDSVVRWVMHEAARQDKAPAVIARDIILIAYNVAKEKTNDPDT